MGFQPSFIFSISPEKIKDLTFHTSPITCIDMPLTQNQAYELLESAKQKGRLGHAFLITGSDKVGKRTLATRIIHMLAPTSSPPSRPLEDMQSEYVRIVRPRSKSRLIKVDDMRALEDSFYMSAPPEQWKIGVIIDADRMNESAANAFLKTLEEPPKNCLLLLLTTAPDRLLTTILSRCITISLFDPEQKSMTPLQQRIEDLLYKTFQQQKRGLIAALSLKTDFNLMLVEEKEELSKKYKKLIQEHAQASKNITDRAYLKEQEEQFKAEEAAEYLKVRTDSINELVSWFGNLLRWKVGVQPTSHLKSKEIFSSFASDLTINDLLPRMEALEELRYLLTETNTSEQLALDVIFIKAFS